MAGRNKISFVHRAVSLLLVAVLVSTALADFGASRPACGTHACCIRQNHCSMNQGSFRFAQCDRDRQLVPNDALAILTASLRTAALVRFAAEGGGETPTALRGIARMLDRPPNA
jgi:hypothetical protein